MTTESVSERARGPWWVQLILAVGPMSAIAMFLVWSNSTTIATQIARHSAQAIAMHQEAIDQHEAEVTRHIDASTRALEVATAQHDAVIELLQQVEFVNASRYNSLIRMLTAICLNLVVGDTDVERETARGLCYAYRRDSHTSR